LVAKHNLLEINNQLDATVTAY